MNRRGATTHYPLPQGSEAVCRRSSSAHCPKAVCGRVPTAHCSLAVQQCTKGVPLPTAPQQCGHAQKESQKEFHCPLPQGTEAVYGGSSPTHCQCGSVDKESHCPLLPSDVAVY